MVAVIESVPDIVAPLEGDEIEIDGLIFSAVHFSVGGKLFNPADSAHALTGPSQLG